MSQLWLDELIESPRTFLFGGNIHTIWSLTSIARNKEAAWTIEDGLRATPVKSEAVPMESDLFPGANMVKSEPGCGPPA
jgi:hypothetical protein